MKWTCSNFFPVLKQESVKPPLVCQNFAALLAAAYKRELLQWPLDSIKVCLLIKKNWEQYLKANRKLVTVVFDNSRANFVIRDCRANIALEWATVFLTMVVINFWAIQLIFPCFRPI